MKRIYITGNIGSGKSSATNIFKENGYKAISADIIAEEVLIENKKEISKAFQINEKDIKLFKKKLGSIIFSNKEKKEELESIVICKILIKIEHLATIYEERNQKFIIESPTYFEVRKMVKDIDDIVILITAPEEIRMERIIKRNPNLTKKDIYNRILSQIDEDRKAKISDYVVSNIDKEVFENDIGYLIKKF